MKTWDQLEVLEGTALREASEQERVRESCLRLGVSTASARAELNRIDARLSEIYREKREWLIASRLKNQARQDNQRASLVAGVGDRIKSRFDSKQCPAKPGEK